MQLSNNNTELSIVFRKAQKNNIADCLSFIKSILELSNSFRVAKQSEDNVGKKQNKTNRIRENINKLVNREGVAPELIDKLIRQIRLGKIEQIVTKIKGHEVRTTAITDFTQLTLKMLRAHSKE